MRRTANSTETKQLALPLEEIAVHCFFRCPYIARATEPQEAHDLMERHYTEKHTHHIQQIVGRWK